MKVIFGRLEDILRFLAHGQNINDLAKPIVRLDNWQPVMSPKGEMHMYGQAYGHPRFKDGEFVTTTPISNANDTMVETRNTLYKLGRMVGDVV